MLRREDVLGILSAVEQAAQYTKEYTTYEREIVHDTIEAVRKLVEVYPTAIRQDKPSV